MVDRRPKLLQDAISAIESAVAFVGDKDIDAYSNNLMLRSAVERQLEVLGEACARLVREEPTLFERFPTCRFAVGLRNRIIHGYDTVDDGILHATVLADLPTLREDLSAWLKQIDPGT